MGGFGREVQVEGLPSWCICGPTVKGIAGEGLQAMVFYIIYLKAISKFAHQDGFDPTPCSDPLVGGSVAPFGLPIVPAPQTYPM